MILAAVEEKSDITLAELRDLLERFPSWRSRFGIPVGARVGFKVSAGEEASGHGQTAVGRSSKPGCGCG